MKFELKLLILTVAATVSLMNGPAVFADTRGCPPGLAKKSTPCVPPGQAKKGVTTEQWLGRDRTGDVIDRDDMMFLDDFGRYNLPPLLSGQRYAVVEDQIVVIDAESYQILQLIRAFTALAD